MLEQASGLRPGLRGTEFDSPDLLTQSYSTQHSVLLSYWASLMASVKIQAAVVQGPAGDDPDHPQGFQRQQGLDVFDGADPARGDDRQMHGFGQGPGSAEIDAPFHPVPGDVGVNQGGGL